MKLILASASPRRRELMALAVPAYEVCVSQVDESALTAPDPAALAQVLARAKCAAVASLRPEDVVVGCDTVVDVDGQVLGKPRDKHDARRMLLSLSGRTHKVHTGVCILAPGEEQLFCTTTEVEFWPLEPQELEKYLASEEPYDKAGAYGIQGGAAKFVRGIRGCYFNVVGLPVSQVHWVLRQMKCWQTLGFGEEC
ncbi:nucleoside triphosphate pyrophosphatase [uncultured Ruthenibacterium sp.]|uniref:Maf family protein n=1 Tax=uncultured Ruthenibacterium sp. TaxID=1905347 RepID=UPI00349E9059